MLSNAESDLTETQITLKALEWKNERLMEKDMVVWRATNEVDATDYDLHEDGHERNMYQFRLKKLETAVVKIPQRLKN